jgi:hypothetical protein
MSNRTLQFLISLLLLPVVGIVVAGGAAWAASTWMPSESSDTSLVCGEALAIPDHEAGYVVDSTRIVVAIDEEWRAVAGADAEAEARKMIVDAASLFRGVHIHLLPVRTVEWNSPDDVESLSGLLEAAEASIPLDDVDIAVVLTAQSVTTGSDGGARVGDRYAIVVRHPDLPERDSTVLAHELSHLFGAHHGCDLPEHEGLMASQGFSEPDLLCPCTRQVLEINANRFHRSLP